MSTHWDEQLKLYENNSNFKDDLSDSITTIFSVARVVASNMPNSLKSHDDLDDIYDELKTSSDGWKNGTQGYGYYRNGMKD
ncbi:hypothetical protein VO451_001380 [Enterobacter hormaechei]|nr:hypothetical protein [Enterobacter hormaechei]